MKRVLLVAPTMEGIFMNYVSKVLNTVFNTIGYEMLLIGLIVFVLFDLQEDKIIEIFRNKETFMLVVGSMVVIIYSLILSIEVIKERETCIVAILKIVTALGTALVLAKFITFISGNVPIFFFILLLIKALSFITQYIENQKNV